MLLILEYFLFCCTVLNRNYGYTPSLLFHCMNVLGTVISWCIMKSFVLIAPFSQPSDIIIFWNTHISKFVRNILCQVARRLLHRPMLVFRMPQLLVIDGIPVSEEERTKAELYFMEQQVSLLLCKSRDVRIKARVMILLNTVEIPSNI